MTYTEEQKENYERARDLQKVVDNWVNKTFNFINVSVYERIAQNPIEGEYSSGLFEYIRQEPIEELVDDYLVDVNKETRENLKQEAKEDIFTDPEDNILSEDEFRQYLVECREEEIRDYYSDRENYPMWSTLFEIKDKFNDREWFVAAAQKVGLGVIDPFDEFNTTFFMTSCGHSFYSAYWIPLYLEFFPEEREKYKSIDFSMI